MRFTLLLLLNAAACSYANLVYFTFEGTITEASYAPNIGSGYKMPTLQGLPLKYVFAADFTRQGYFVRVDGTVVEPKDDATTDYFFSDILFSIDYLPPGEAIYSNALEGHLGVRTHSSLSPHPTATGFAGRYFGHFRGASSNGWEPSDGITESEFIFIETVFVKDGEYNILGSGKLVNVSETPPSIPEPLPFWAVLISFVLLLTTRRTFLQKAN